MDIGTARSAIRVPAQSAGGSWKTVNVRILIAQNVKEVDMIEEDRMFPQEEDQSWRDYLSSTGEILTDSCCQCKTPILSGAVSCLACDFELEHYHYVYDM